MDTGYRIGAVAKLTGISTDTIRAWERRYQVVEPNRGENNNRYYTEQHIGKLISVKRLVDAGQAIGTVCRLSEQELKDRTRGILGASRQSSGESLKKWAIISVQQPEWLKACVSAQPGVQASWVPSLEGFSPTHEEFIVIDMPSLSEVNEKLVLRMIPDEFAARCLVVYRFASRTQLRSLTSRGIRLLKGPLEPFALVNLLNGDAHTGATRADSLAAKPAKRLLQKEDVQVQLTELVNALDQFEANSSECLRHSAVEKALQQRLLGLTGQARSILEQALSDMVAKGDTEKRKRAGLIS